MQISTSLFYDRGTAQMGSLNQQADTLQNQIATGKKLSAPSDDVTAYQRLQTIAKGTADDTAYAANTTLATAILSQADSALSSVTSQITQAQTLAVQAANGTLSDSGKQAIATQLRGIVSTLASLANSSDTRGQPLFGGAAGGTPVTQNADGGVTINDTGSVAAIPIGDGDDVVPGETASRVFGGIAASDGSTTDVFKVLNTLADALDAGGDTSAATSAAITDLKTASTHVSAVQSSIGARETRVGLQASQITADQTARETDRSALEDTDITSAVTDLQKTMTVLQATQASFTKLTSLSLFDYLN